MISLGTWPAKFRFPVSGNSIHFQLSSSWITPSLASVKRIFFRTLLSQVLFFSDSLIFFIKSINYFFSHYTCQHSIHQLKKYTALQHRQSVYKPNPPISISQSSTRSNGTTACPSCAVVLFSIGSDVCCRRL